MEKIKSIIEQYIKKLNLNIDVQIEDNYLTFPYNENIKILMETLSNKIYMQFSGLGSERIKFTPKTIVENKDEVEILDAPEKLKNMSPSNVSLQNEVDIANLKKELAQNAAEDIDVTEFQGFLETAAMVAIKSGKGIEDHPTFKEIALIFLKLKKALSQSQHLAAGTGIGAGQKRGLGPTSD